MDIILKRPIHLLYLLAIPFLLLACSPIKNTSELMIEGMPALETVLIVEETYTEGAKNEYRLPKGVYYPSFLATADSVSYYAPEKISVGFLLFSGSTMCEGGINVDINNPYDEHVMFARNCQADPGFIVNLERKVKFKIVSHESLQAQASK